MNDVGNFRHRASDDTKLPTQSYGVRALSFSPGHFKSNLRHLMVERDVSMRRLSIAVGKHPGYFAELLGKESLPSIDVICQIANYFSVSVDDLLRPLWRDNTDRGDDVHTTAEAVLAHAMQIARRRLGYDGPAQEEVYEWWLANGGRFEGYERFGGFVETFDIPDAERMIPRPETLGRRSLAAREFSMQHPSELEVIIRSSDQALMREIGRAHRRAATEGPQVDLLSIGLYVGGVERIDLEFQRLLLPVTLPDGRTHILNYSKAARRVSVALDKSDDVLTCGDSKPMLTPGRAGRLRPAERPFVAA